MSASIIHETLATGHGCHHPKFGTPECVRVAEALASTNESDPCRCGHSRYEHPQPCSASACGCIEFHREPVSALGDHFAYPAGPR